MNSSGSSNTYAPQRPWRLAPDGSLVQDELDEVAFGTPSARRYSVNNDGANVNGAGTNRSSNSNRELLQQQEALINSYEAEEERIINSLVRKLEELREEKIQLERTHEEESESHVNRLARQIAALRMQAQGNNDSNASSSQAPTNASDDTAATATAPAPATTAAAATATRPVPSSSSSRVAVAAPLTSRVTASTAGDPSTEVIMEALRKENETLRNRLVKMERDWRQEMRLNEIYREELIRHRRRLGISVDNLIGAADPFSQPTHLRSSTSTSPTASMVALPMAHSMPIPRQAQQTRRAHMPTSSVSSSVQEISEPSSASSTSPYISPVLSAIPGSYVSEATQLTTPPSSASLQSNPPGLFPLGPPPLSYPSVPPPSLSSSLGSPVVLTHMIPGQPPSPIAPLSRRGSHSQQQQYGSGERRVVETGNLMSRSRRTSVERGGRIAEQGTLVGRNRASSSGAASGAAGIPGYNAHESAAAAMAPPMSQSEAGVIASVEEGDELAME